MKVIMPASPLGLAAPSSTLGIQGASLSGFQSRLVSAGSVRASASEADPTGADIIHHTMHEMRSLLRLQYELSRGTDTLISNVMKTRHETAKNAIGNIR